MIRPIAALVIAAVSAAVLAQAPTRIRGTLEKVDGNLLSVKTRTGEVMNVKVPDNVLLVGIARASMADIGKGKFIGTTTVGPEKTAPSSPKKCTSSPRTCAAPAKATATGTCGPRAR